MVSSSSSKEIVTKVAQVAQERVIANSTTNLAANSAFHSEIFDEVSTFLRKLIKKGDASETSGLQIKLLDGAEEKNFEFRSPVITIGRALTSDIQLADRYVSREHAQIIRQQNHIFIKDLGSTNGTSVNKQALQRQQECPLFSGDVIQIERFKLFVHFGASPSASSLNLQLLPVTIEAGQLQRFLARISKPVLLAEFQLAPNAEMVYLNIEIDLVRNLLRYYQRNNPQIISADRTEFSETQKRLFENILIEFEDFYNRRHIKGELPAITFVRLTQHVTGPAIAGEQAAINLHLKLVLDKIEGLVNLTLPGRLQSFFNTDVWRNVPRSQQKSTPIPGKLPTPAPVISGRPSGEIVVPQFTSIRASEPAAPRDPKFERLKAIPTLLKLELGTLSISPYDFMSLEVDEVLLLRDLDLIFTKNQLKGRILLKLENDEEYYWIGWIQPEQPALYTIQIKEIFKTLATHSEVSGRLILANSNSLKNKANRTGAQPTLNADSEKRLATLEASIPGFSRTDLLKGIKLTVTLEMSQIKLKFADIMQLKPEQLIQIHHALPPLVNLMVNKQMIAQGILIEHPEGCALKLTKI